MLHIQFIDFPFAHCVTEFLISLRHRASGLTSRVPGRSWWRARWSGLAVPLCVRLSREWNPSAQINRDATPSEIHWRENGAKCPRGTGLNPPPKAV